VNRIPDFVKFLIGVGLVLGTTILVGNVLLAFLPKGPALFLIIAIFIAGWIFMIGTVAGGPKGGLQILRFYVRLYGGLSIAMIPMVLLPNLFTFLIGGVLGVAFATWCWTGRATWLHRE
jgi:hypothetical protein